MPEWGWIVIVIYGLGMFFIFSYSLVQLSLLLQYRKKNKKEVAKEWEGDWPTVLIQLPVFNERYVVERLIEATCQLDYPKDKLSIQLLDDSTDESFEIASAVVSARKGEGINIEQVKRPVRKGFKAGALQYGLDHTEAEFVAIFDADFIPDKDFLKEAIPQFIDEGIGMVQSRWGHLNRDYSLLTRVQAFALDAHFTVEQSGRNIGNHFINFNGTAGVWRRKCILDAGGWSADTLTEDLDLSYRAQLKGWKFKFIENVVSPAELPAEMNALKNQQYR
ncbi:MAG: cellulose synthase/poly-beta-1,6-N-acetylglucosamine synthase-like glycosyltransferase, partial [Cryomorphaceae bacterium]